MEPLPNHLSLLTEDELAAGLALIAGERTAAAVAAAVYRIPPAERIYYEWIDTALLLASCASGRVAERILDQLTATPETRADLARRQADFSAWCRGRERQPDALLSVEDVVYDTRSEMAG